MKKVLITLLSLTLCAGELLMPVCAQEAQMSKAEIYEKELAVAVKSGTGTEDDPYEVDYSLAPEFYSYICDNWNQKNYGSDQTGQTRSESDTGFTGYVLTNYYGIKSNGGMWLYSSGGMNVDTNGNLRIKKVVYTPKKRLGALYAVRTSLPGWTALVNEAGNYASSSFSVVSNGVAGTLIDAGFSVIGGYAALTIGTAVATTLGTAANTIATIQFLQIISASRLNTAKTNQKNYITIYYLSAYNGLWYSSYIDEVGWKNDKIYAPATAYGSGTWKWY